MKAITYVHGSKESMHELGKKLGLTGEALNMFRYTACEVKLELDVNMKTGEARIVAVDDRPLMT